MASLTSPTFNSASWHRDVIALYANETNVSECRPLGPCWFPHPRITDPEGVLLHDCVGTLLLVVTKHRMIPQILSPVRLRVHRVAKLNSRYDFHHMSATLLFLVQQLLANLVTDNPYQNILKMLFIVEFLLKKTNKQTPWPLVRKKTIPTDRPPLVGEI
jgi:hypothetical protein